MNSPKYGMSPNMLGTIFQIHAIPQHQTLVVQGVVSLLPAAGFGLPLAYSIHADLFTRKRLA